MVPNYEMLVKEASIKDVEANPVRLAAVLSGSDASLAERVKRLIIEDLASVGKAAQVCDDPTL